MLRANKAKLIFIWPAALWVLVFTIFPLFYGLRLSLYNVKIGFPDEFIGLKNYLSFFTDNFAFNSVKVTLIFVIVGIAIEMTLGMLIALLFNRPLPIRDFLRTIMIMPLFATPIAVGFLFFTIFYEEGGLINGLLGLLNIKVPWLSSPNWALFAVILVDVWLWTPFVFLLFLAALQGVPDDYYEAASLETKSGWKIFRYVVFPILQPTIIIVFLLRATEAFKIFDIPFTLTAGGPGMATQVLSMYAYRVGMRFFNFGYSSAISFLLFILVMVFVTVMFKRIRQIYQ